jgi:hypothetical protein
MATRTSSGAVRSAKAQWRPSVKMMGRSCRRAVRWVEPAWIAMGIAMGLAACNTNSSPTVNEGCGPSNPCTTGLVCGYPINAGCVNTGICVPIVPSNPDCVPMVACGCFGGTVAYGCNFYSGYAPGSVALKLELDECTGGGEGGLANDGAVAGDGAVAADGAAAGDSAAVGDGAMAADGAMASDGAAPSDGAPDTGDGAAAGDGEGANDGAAAGDSASDAGDGGP